MCAYLFAVVQRVSPSCQIVSEATRSRNAAGGLDFDYPGFVHTVLVGMRAWLARSARPGRVLEVTLDAAWAAGLVGRLDPFSGQLASRAVSATITGPSLALADALATAIPVGRDEVLGIVAGLDGLAGYLIRADGSETHTSRITFAD